MSKLPFTEFTRKSHPFAHIASTNPIITSDFISWTRNATNCNSQLGIASNCNSVVIQYRFVSDQNCHVIHNRISQNGRKKTKKEEKTSFPNVSLPLNLHKKKYTHNTITEEHFHLYTAIWSRFLFFRHKFQTVPCNEG